jgi:polynucleotide 5'-kinase involved in rRNA processing
VPEALKIARSSDTEGALATEISDRLSQELVIALVGPVGSGVSTTAAYLSEVLSQKFGYKVALL